MSHSSRFALFGLVLSSVLAGCTTPAPAPQPAPVDPVSKQLDVTISKSHSETPVGPEVKIAAPVYSISSNTVSYLGDARNLLKDVSAAMKWDFKVTGPAPQLPIYVQIDVAGVPMKDFLSQLATQLSQRADIVVGRQVIELRYRAN